MQQQQGNLQQPVYHHQQMPPQMQPQYQAQPYQTQPQYVITQAQAAQLQDRPRQNIPNDPSMPPSIYHQQMGPGLPQNVLYHQQVSVEKNVSIFKDDEKNKFKKKIVRSFYFL